jgi:uncharacterized protein (UPF0254 family)
MTKGKDDKDKKVGKVGASDSTKGVKSTEAVSDVDKVKATSAVGRVSAVSGVGATGSIGRITLDQRDRLMSIVTEEAAKLAAQGVIPQNQREIVEQAVKMVIDASLDESSDDKKR